MTPDENDSRWYYLRRNHTTVWFNYPDSSQWLRNRLRAGWSEGYHLYNLDVNNNIQWVKEYVNHWVHFRRYRNPTWFVTPFPRFLMDARARPIGLAAENAIMRTFPTGSQQFRPWPGATCYILTDDLVMAYDGEKWCPLMRIKDSQKNVEVAIFATNTGPRGKPYAKHVVAEPFIVYAGTTLGRVRNYSSRNPPIQILKNGELVGYAWQSKTSSGVRMIADTPFDVGDTLELMVPGHAKIIRSNVSVSIVGGLPE